jgi:hypothetical protein
MPPAQIFGRRRDARYDVGIGRGAVRYENARF